MRWQAGVVERVERAVVARVADPVEVGVELVGVGDVLAVVVVAADAVAVDVVVGVEGAVVAGVAEAVEVRVVLVGVG